LQNPSTLFSTTATGEYIILKPGWARAGYSFSFGDAQQTVVCWHREIADAICLVKELLFLPKEKGLRKGWDLNPCALLHASSFRD
jgi:hypothetical protein